jgi:hypothetical protein
MDLTGGDAHAFTEYTVSSMLWGRTISGIRTRTEEWVTRRFEKWLLRLGD